MHYNKLLRGIKRTTQNFLGFRNYLYVISLLKYSSLKTNKVEQDIYKFIELIPDNCIILDVGSNIGVIASTLAKKKKSCSIYCFEPIPANAGNIKRLMKTFNLKNISLKQMAIGSTKGIVRMIVPAHDKVLYEGHSHITNEEDDSAGLRFEVSIDKLDNLFDSYQQAKISAIKLDVENHEFEVLKGAYKILSDNKPVIFSELWHNEVRFDVIDYLKKIGYQCYVNKKNSLQISDGTDADDLNFFFLKEA